MPSETEHWERHKARHRALHASLDELVADLIVHTGKRPSTTTILELIEWSYKQTLNPDHESDGKHRWSKAR